MKLKLPFKKQKKSKEDEIRSNVSKSVVKIIVKRLIGGRIPTEVAKFDAVQKRGDDFNLQLVSVENNFKEEVTIVRDPIIDFLLYKLDFGKGSAKEKMEIVKKKIKEQEDLLKSIEKGAIIDSDGNEVKRVNYIDEEVKLNQYKVLLDVVQHLDEGSYEEINQEGFRQISFLYNDGILIPYYHIASKATLFPDVGSKRKIYKAEQDLINQEYRDENGSRLSQIFKNFMLVAFIILFIANVYWTGKLMQNHNKFAEQLDSSAWQELLDKAEGSAVNCAYYLSVLADENEYFINYAKEELNKTTSTTKNKDGLVNIG